MQSIEMFNPKADDSIDHLCYCCRLVDITLRIPQSTIHSLQSQQPQQIHRQQLRFSDRIE